MAKQRKDLLNRIYDLIVSHGGLMKWEVYNLYPQVYGEKISESSVSAILTMLRKDHKLVVYAQDSKGREIKRKGCRVYEAVNDHNRHRVHQDEVKPVLIESLLGEELVSLIDESSPFELREAFSQLYREVLSQKVSEGITEDFIAEAIKNIKKNKRSK